MLPAHVYYHLGTHMIFNNKMYELQITAGKFDKGQSQLGENKGISFYIQNGNQP